jgi:hypothetical protein
MLSINICLAAAGIIAGWGRHAVAAGGANGGRRRYVANIGQVARRRDSGEDNNAMVLNGHFCLAPALLSVFVAIYVRSDSRAGQIDYRRVWSQ